MRQYHRDHILQPPWDGLWQHAGEESPWIQEEQCSVPGHGHGTLDQLFFPLEVVWRCMGICSDHMRLVKLEMAFSLQKYGVTCPLLQVIQSLVHIVGTKLGMFLVRVRLCQGSPLLQILCITFIDRISQQSLVEEGFCFCGLRITFLLFADDVLLASSCRNHQCELQQVAAEYEVAGIRISTSKGRGKVRVPWSTAKNGWSALVRDNF